MVKTVDYIETVGKIVQDLNQLGSTPILIGGMALVILGSRRVTKDFDFLISKQVREQKELADIFYKHGFELVSKIDKLGNIIATIDNPRIASMRLRLDTPVSVHFLNRKTGLQIDLLFDFPISADAIFPEAQMQKIQSYVFYIASKKDLLRLKEMAHDQRKSAGDAQDIEFLKTILK